MTRHSADAGREGGRMLQCAWISLAFCFIAVTAYLAYAFVTMPCTTGFAFSCGSGVFLGACFTGAAAMLSLGIAGAYD